MKLEVLKVERANTVRKTSGQAVVYAKITLRDVQSGMLFKNVPIFDTEAEDYLSLLPTGVNVSDDTYIAALPEKKKFWDYVFQQTFVFPEQMTRVDDKNQPVLNQRGVAYTRSSVEVLTRYVYDEQRKLLDPNASPLYPLTGWSLETQGLSVMNAFYMPSSHFQNGPMPAEAPGSVDMGI